MAHQESTEIYRKHQNVYSLKPVCPRKLIMGNELSYCFVVQIVVAFPSLPSFRAYSLSNLLNLG